jgi:DNA phosphorothioation-dependent restriction protein DptH
VIPGLTEGIADQLHEALRAESLPSLLIVPESVAPSQVQGRLRAEGLTSLRHGDMIIIAWPGELSRIQDSVIGAGGTIRNFAFSDEWPWLDDSNEYFKFDGPFVELLLDELGARGPDRDWLKTVILAIVRATRGSVSRSGDVLEEIVGRFDPSAHAELASLRAKFLYHCGIPVPEDPARATAWDVTTHVLKPAESLGKVIAEARRQVETREDLLERIDELEPDLAQRARLHTEVNGLLDGLASHAEKQHVGVLTLRGCWGPATDRWAFLTLPLLRRLFDPSASAPEVRLDAQVTTRQGVVAPDGKEAVLFEFGLLEVTITYDGLTDQQVGVAELIVLQGVRRLWQQPCAGPRALAATPIVASIPYDDIFRSTSRKRPLRVQLAVGGHPVAEQRVTVHPCGTNSPIVLLLQPDFEVYPGRERVDDEEPEQRRDVSAPVSVTLLVNDAQREPSVDIDGGSVPLSPDPGNPQILNIPRPLDPTSSPSGRISLSIWLDTVGIDLDIEAADYEHGEFTLERELVVHLAQGNTGKVDRLLAVFTGTSKQPYTALGGLNDLTRARIRYARAFEIVDAPGLPIIADLLRPVPESEPQRQGWVLASANVDPGRLRQLTPAPPVQELIEKYRLARHTVMATALEDSTNSDERWPVYARLPIFVERRRGKIEPALVEYLGVYGEIVNFLSRPAPASWDDCLLLSALDCVVHWGRDPLFARAFLVGPWHPLVVAKRFMIQAALLATAKRFSSKQSRGFNKLATLLDQVNSFRWFPILTPDDASFDNAYVSATTDPGWLLAINAGSIQLSEAEILVSSVRRYLGLEAAVMPLAREQMASSYLREFHRAYPSRRAISIAAAQLYSGQRIVESAASVLYAGDDDDDNDITPTGRLLPGGLHLFLHDASEVHAMRWRSPPICIYDARKETSWGRSYKDISLLPPGKPRATPVRGAELPLARGRGDLAALCAPVRRIAVAAQGVPNSFAFERDTEGRNGSTVGEVFVRVLHLAGQLGGTPLSSSWSIDLPENLQFLWNVVPGGQIDPAVLVQYVRLGYKAGQPRVLWDYSMSLAGPSNSYFVLSQVPPSITVVLNGSPVLGGKDVAKDIIRELAEIGVAVGSESMRSGSRALGVIGFVAAVRLFSDHNGGPSPLRNEADSRGFLLPVDSFKQILGDGMDDGGDGRRADLIACQLELDESRGLQVFFAAIECKYTSYSLTDDDLALALEQAGRTHERMLRLVEAARSPLGIPERLALVSLVSFGLRLRPPADDQGLRVEHEILRRLLDGEFEIASPLAGSVAVITECAGTSATIVRREGFLVKLSPGHWPGIAESASLVEVRQQLSRLFRPRELATNVDVAPPVTSGGVQGPATDGGAPEMPAQAAALGPAATVSPALGRLAPILLGTAGDRRAVYYDPQSARRPLDNYNVMITGSSGKGKTQLIKAVIAELRRQKRSVFLLDFKNDFASDPVFLSLSGLNCRYVTFEGLPYNPLIPMPVKHPATGQAVLQVSQHVSGIAAVLARTFGLGAQQEAALKDVIRECFRDRGLDPSGTSRYDPQANFPDFNDVGERLKTANALAYNRMDPLFDLGVFSSTSRNTTFEAILGESSVVDLSQIQSDTIKNAIAKILVLSAHAYYNARPHSSVLRQFFVFDEAHRVLDTEFLVRFVRECRAYGVGIMLSSQYPTDFPQEVSASLNTKVLHGNGSERDRVRDIQRMLGSATDEAIVAQLGLFEAFVSSPHHDAVKVRTLAYPHFLVLSAIRARAVRRHDLRVDGVDAERLPLDFLVEALLEMGLVEEEAGTLRAREIS